MAVVADNSLATLCTNNARIETTSASEAQSQAAVAVDENAIITVEAEPEATLEEKVENFLISTAYFGSYTIEAGDKTISAFCGARPDFDPKQVLQMIGICMCSAMAFSRESCYDP